VKTRIFGQACKLNENYYHFVGHCGTFFGLKWRILTLAKTKCIKQSFDICSQSKLKKTIAVFTLLDKIKQKNSLT